MHSTRMGSKLVWAAVLAISFMQTATADFGECFHKNRRMPMPMFPCFGYHETVWRPWPAECTMPCQDAVILPAPPAPGAQPAAPQPGPAPLPNPAPIPAPRTAPPPSPAPAPGKQSLLPKPPTGQQQIIVLPMMPREVGR